MANQPLDLIENSISTLEIETNSETTTLEMETDENLLTAIDVAATENVVEKCDENSNISEEIPEKIREEAPPEIVVKKPRKTKIVAKISENGYSEELATAPILAAVLPTEEIHKIQVTIEPIDEVETPRETSD